jgi:asparagine synthase (glutamine-hydrolysing)
MCGIAGLRLSDPRGQVSRALLAGMTDSLVHRGPDGRGQELLGRVGLGHRRLAIIDLAGGAQPMSDAAGDVWLTYNGEIYNFRELQAELEAAGHTFRTRCDTEVLIHGWKEWGEDLPARCRGMFAFALHDRRTDTLLLARDRMGIKPLYYTWADGDLFFASEVRALLATGRVHPEPEVELVDAYATLGYVPGERTFFKGVLKLLPAHQMVVDGAGARTRRYWDLARVPDVDLDYAGAKAHLKDLFARTLEEHLMSDVPLGCFLSGGVDSTCVVAFLRKELGRDVSTFTVGYPEDQSEVGHAGRVAQLFGTDHHVFELTHDNFFAGIETLLEHSEEPLVESAAVALLELSRFTKPHATVMLSGEGADEVFGGYPLYARNFQLDKLHNLAFPLRSRAVRAALQPVLRSERLKKYVDWIGLPLDARHHGNSADVTPSLRPSMYRPEFAARVGTALRDEFARHYAEVQHRDPLARMQYADMKTWLVDDLLLKADKMTMAASLELRVPFLDHPLVEFGLGLDAGHKLRGGVGKALLKDMLSEYVPRDLLYRTKQGFPVPVSRWFREDLHQRVRALLLDERHLDRGYFRPEYVRRVLDRHGRGAEDLGRRLFSLVVLELWHRRYVDGARAVAATEG